MLGRLSTVSRSFLSSLADSIDTERAKRELRPLMDDISGIVDRSCAFFELVRNYDSLILHLRDSEQAISQAITNSAPDIHECLFSRIELLQTLLRRLRDDVQLTQLSLGLQSGAGYSTEIERLIELMKSFKFSRTVHSYNRLIALLSTKASYWNRARLINALKVTDQKFDRTCWVRFIFFLYAGVSHDRLRYNYLGRFVAPRFVALDSFSKRVNASSQLHDLIGPIALRCARDPNSSFGFKLYFEKTFDEPNVDMFVDPDSLPNLIRRAFIDLRHIDPLQLANRWMRCFDYHRALDPRARSIIKENNISPYVWFLDQAETEYSSLLLQTNLPLLENRAVICHELRRFVINLITLYSDIKYLRVDGSIDDYNIELNQVLTEPIRAILIERNRTSRNFSS